MQQITFIVNRLYSFTELVKYFTGATFDQNQKLKNK